MNLGWGRIVECLRRGLVSLVIGLASSGLLAQPNPSPQGAYAFKGYGVDQGLSNLSVTAMAQDAKGYLWVGTEDGLFRLEGGRMRRFGTQDGLPHSAVDAAGLTATDDGGLWVRIISGNELKRYFWNGTHFLRPAEMGHPEFEKAFGVPIGNRNLIFADSQLRRFVCKGQGKVQELIGLPHVGGLVAAAKDEKANALRLILGTTLWFQQGQGWGSRDLAAFTKGAIQNLAVDHRGRIWIRSTRALIRLTQVDGPVEDLTSRAELGRVDTCYLSEDGLGRMWTNTPGSLVWFDDDSSGHLGEDEGLPQGGSNILLMDREGSLWIGGEGVHRLLGRFLWKGFTRRQGLPAHVVWSLARSRDGILWAGTADGLAFADAKKWTAVPGTARRQFMTFAEDDQGRLWAAPSVEEGEQPRLFVHRAGIPGMQPVFLAGLKPGDTVTALAWDPRGFLWAGGGGNLHRVTTGAKPTATLEPVPNWPKDGVGINALSVGRDGGVWVGSTEGLAHWDGATWRTLGKANGWPEPSLMAVASLGDQTAWVAFRNVKGLSKIALRDGKLQVLETFQDSHPLTAQSITSLKLDPSGALWLGTSLGVRRWDGTHLESFGRDWGLPGEDCAQNALWIDHDGDAWVGLSVGIAHYDRDAKFGDLMPIPSDLTGIQDGQGKTYLPGTAPVVPWRWRTMAFTITSLSYLNESRIRHQVRLVGFEDEWREAEGREVRYTGLPAGAFRFEVRAGRDHEPWGPILSQRLQILPPWWQTYWFYALAGGLAAWVLYLGFRLRDRIMFRRMVDLEAQVHERTWDLEEANKALEVASMVDPLTGLKNRRFLRLAMPEAEARSIRAYRHAEGEAPRGEDMLFFMVDLDHFKQVNDVHGHAAGDEVLRQVADVLRSACRESDTVVRWGGEEFLIVAAGADRFAAAVIAENICNRFRAVPFRLADGTLLPKTCSVGFAAFPLLPGAPTAHPWEGAVEVADQCLYAAKKSGRDGWVGVFRGDMDFSEGLQERLPKDVVGLIQEEALTLQTSFPDPQALAWKDRLRG